MDADEVIFKNSETISLLKRIYSLREQNHMEPELFEAIDGSPFLERFSAVELRHRFTQLKTEGTLAMFVQALPEEMKDWFKKTFLQNGNWTDAKEVRLLQEIYSHRASFGTRDFWQSLRVGNIGGPLDEFTAEDLKRCFKRLIDSQKIDIISIQLDPIAQAYFAGLQTAHAEVPAQVGRIREGWSPEEDKRLLEIISSYGQERFRHFNGAEQFPGKLRSDIKDRYLDFLVEGQFIAKKGKVGNHHRSKPKGRARKSRIPFSNEEVQEIAFLHKYFCNELQNPSPWMYIWLASEKVLSSRTTVDIKDKFRIMTGERKHGPAALITYCQKNGYTYIPSV